MSNVIDFLSFIFLYNDFIRYTCRTHRFNTFHQRLLGINFTTNQIKAIGCYTNYQIVT